MVSGMRSRKYFAVALSLSLIALVASIPSNARSRGGGAPRGGVILQTPNPQTPVEHNNRGVELGQKGLWSDAIREHEIALQMDPYSSQWRTNLSAAHLEYGKWLVARQKYDLASAEFRRAMIIDPANAQADEQLDNVLRRLKRDPDDPRYRRSLAEDADANGQYDTAIVEFRKLKKISGDPIAQADLGFVLIKAGGKTNTQAGFKELRNAVGRNDWRTDDESRKKLATCHAKLGDILRDSAMHAKDIGKGTTGMQRLYNAAIEYRRAVTINPAYAPAIDGLLFCAQQAVAIKPSFDNHLYLAGAYLLAGKFPQAQNEYNECFKLKPKSPVLSTARIAYHQAVARNAISSPEQVNDSVTKVKKLIDDDADNPRLFYILGRLRERQVEQGTELNYDKAKKCYEKAMTLNPTVDPDLKIALSRIGVAPPIEGPKARDTSNNVAQSKEAMQKAMKEKQYTDFQSQLEEGTNLDELINKGQEMFGKDNKDGRIAGLIGRAYEKKGDSDSLNSAKSWYRIGGGLGDAASARFLEQVDASRVLTKLKDANDMFDQKKFIEAKSLYQDILIMAPKRGDVHRKLGDCLKELGDKEGAKKEYADADAYDRGETPKPIVEDKPADKTPIGDAAPSAGNDKGKKGEKIAKTEKPPDEQGLKAESLQMQPIKKKK